MDNNGKTSEKITKWVLIGISILFLAVMLLLPLVTVITEALRSGWKVYAEAVTDEYTVKALLLTVKATLFAVTFNTAFGIFAAWALTKFQFRGKKLLTTLIDLRYYVLVPYAQGIKQLEDVRDTVKIESILTTSDQAYSKTDLNSNTIEKEDGDVEGPFDLGVSITESLDDDKETQIVYYSTSNLMDSQTNQMVSGDI